MAKKPTASIPERAYQLWEAEGRPEGRDLDHWLQAEAEATPAKPAAKPRRASAKPKASAAAPKKPAAHKKTAAE